MTLERVEFLTDKHGGQREHNQLLVIHTSEGASTYRALGSYFQHTSKQASYHVGFDNTSNNKIGEYVKPPYQSWSAHRANHYGEHGCCCTPVGAAQGWSRAQWLAQPNMLEACRRWIQEEGARYGIPARKLSPDDIRKGMKGVCGHADCVAAGMGGNHTDPGPNFPWDVVCATSPPPEGDDELNDQDKQWIRANIQDVVTDVLRKEGVSGAAQKEHSTVDDDIIKKLDQIIAKLP